VKLDLAGDAYAEESLNCVLISLLIRSEEESLRNILREREELESQVSEVIEIVVEFTCCRWY
jgi:hypothetical protein